MMLARKNRSGERTRPVRPTPRLGRGDAGSALLEFVVLAVLLMIPLAYLVLIAARVEGAAFGVTTAARDAGRAYATSGSDALGRVRALLAAQLALAADGVRLPAGDVRISCGPCTYAPGSPVSVTVSYRVPLPGLPAALCSGASCLAAIPVSATHLERLPCFAPPAAAAAAAPPAATAAAPPVTTAAGATAPAPAAGAC
jgi:hypothetical protein